MKEIHKSTKYILFAIALLDFMGFTISATIFPNLLLDKNFSMLPSFFAEGQRLIAVGILLGLYPLGQFFSATILGGLSDYYGRRKILLLSVGGTVLTTFLCALSINLKLSVLLFVSRFLAGLFAGNVAVTQASMIDISDLKSKAANISLIQLSLGIAWVIGAPLGSFLSNNHFVFWFNMSVPFWLLGVALLFIFVIITIFYKETLQHFHKHKIHPLKGIQLTYLALSSPRFRSIFIVFMIFIGGWALFLQFLPTFLTLNFNYTVSNVGPMLAFMGGTFAATQLFIARRVLKRYTAEAVLRITMLIPGLATLGVMLSSTWLELHIAAFLFPFSMGFTLPSLFAAISNRGEQNEQGLLLGMAQSIQALMTIIITMVGGQLLAIDKHLSTLVSSIAMISAWFIFITIVNRKVKPGVQPSFKVSNHTME